MELGCHVVFLLFMHHLQVAYVIYVISVPVCMSQANIYIYIYTHARAHTHTRTRVHSDNGSLYKECMWYVCVYIRYIQYMYYKLAL
jgi:hypothetical protein